MTLHRRLQLTAAVVLGVIMPCGATLWFFKTTIGRESSLVGKDAPDFEVVTTAGEVVSLSAYDGKRLALLFVNLDCPPCVEQLGCLDGLNVEFSNSKLGMLAVSESDRERVAGFAGEFTLSVPMVIDDGSLRRDYQVNYEPTLVLIDENRIVRFCKRGGLPPVRMRRLVGDFGAEGKIPLEALVGGDPSE